MSNTNLMQDWYKTEIGKKVVEKKYLHADETDFAELAYRVGNIFYDNPFGNQVEQAIYNADFFPAGRALYGAGAKGKFRATLSNCYILPSPEDNIESINEVCGESARIYSYGGGAGVNLSKLRPNGARVANSAGTSTGPCSFMKIFDSYATNIGSNNRRAALMIGLDCSHPDIEEFLTVKQNDTEIQAANISILFTDEFMEAVDRDEEYALHFETQYEKIEKTINAREFFYKVAEANHSWAEPGCLFIDTIRANHLLSGYPEDEYKIEIANPCVTGDTLILTDKGHVKIKDVIGQPVNVWNGYEYSEVHPRITGHNQKMKRIVLSNGMELDCTQYHKFVLKGGSRIEAKDLRVGDRLAKWNYPTIEGESTLENAYTHGFYSGDGTKGLPQIALSNGKRDLLPYFDYKSFTEVNENRITVRLNNNGYEKDFVPTNEYSVSSRLQWLAGLLDSDGTLNDKGGSLSISSVDRAFLRKVQLMLTTLGAHSSIGLMHTGGLKEMPKNDGSGENGIYNCQDSYRIVISSYNVSKLSLLGLETYRIQLGFEPNRDASRFIQVSEIVDIPDEETVYCFTEPKNNTGVFNGVMTAQCGEYFGAAYNACNLGSINLYNVVKNPFTDAADIDWEKLSNLTRMGIRALDEILDIGYETQPLDANRREINKWRAIGLGVFGLADMLIALGITYGSTKARELVSVIGRVMFENALLESAMIANEKGTFDKYDWEKVKQSPLISRFEGTNTYNTIKECGLRNGSLLSIAPTGSISTMCGVSGGAEPLFAISYDRTTHSQLANKNYFKVYAKSVEGLLNAKGIPLDTPIEEIQKMFPYVVASHNVAPIDRVKMQASLQNWIDNAISSTINLKHEATVEDVYDTYLEAWKHGCKGVTVFRDGCSRTPILTTKPTKEEKECVEVKGEILLDTLDPMSAKQFDRLPSSRYLRSTSCVPSMYVHVVNKEGKILEVFTSSEHGCKSNLGTITRLASLALRSGIKVEKVCSELASNTCLACVGKQGKSLSCGHAVASAIMEEYRRLVRVFPYPDTKPAEPKPEHEYLPCPQCGKLTLVPEGRCATCVNCLYSKCD